VGPCDVGEINFLLLSIEEYQNVSSDRCVGKRREVRRELVRCMKDAKDWVLVLLRQDELAVNVKHLHQIIFKKM